MFKTYRNTDGKYIIEPEIVEVLDTLSEDNPIVIVKGIPVRVMDTEYVAHTDTTIVTVEYAD